MYGAAQSPVFRQYRRLKGKYRKLWKHGATSDVLGPLAQRISAIGASVPAGLIRVPEDAFFARFPTSGRSGSTGKPRQRQLSRAQAQQVSGYGADYSSVDQALVDGIGGLEFTAQSPPGTGRLVRLPFYLATAAAGFVCIEDTGAAAAAAPVTSTTNPLVFPNTAVAAVGIQGNAVLVTPQISWATLRIVGFEMDVVYPAVPSTPVPEVMVQDLQIGGGANLLVHEDFAPAGIYASYQSSFCGLRDYPVLQSPNTAQVTVSIMRPQALNAAAFPPANADMINPGYGVCPVFSASLVVEVLQDDNYGSHIPGPYARKGAMVRRGGSFVS